ncbi:putative quinol monooxygenase [Luteimonas salinisoli]|nr:putative quinol monooxygenase [Luteimonas salinisoli]
MIRIATACLALALLAASGYAPAQTGDPLAPARNATMPTSHADARYGLTGTMRATPGNRDAVVALLLRDVAELKPAGCHLYVVGLDPEDADLIRVTEVWDSRQAHRDSLQLPSVRAAIAEAMPMLTGEFTRTEFSAVGGLGLPE